MNNHKIKLLGVGFILLVIGAFLVGLVKSRRYRDYLGANVLVLSESSSCIFSVRPKSSVMDYSRLPDALKITLGVGEGSYDVGSLRRVGIVGDTSLEKLRKGVGQEIGVLLGFVIKTKGGCDALSLREGLLDFGSKTNISMLDRLALANDINQLVIRGLGFEQVMPNSVFDKVTEPDGKIFLIVNQAMQYWNKNHFVSDEVLSEAAEIAVVNGSGKEGLGREVAKQIETIGIRVVEIGKEDQTPGRCRVRGETKKYRLTFEYLERYLGCEIVEKGSGSSQFEGVLVLGSAY